MRLVLRSDGYKAFKKIYSGRKWIGRVVPHAEGGYYARIGKTCEARAATEREAFDEVCAKFFGFESAQAMDDHNAVVRAKNRVNRARANYAMQEIMRGNFKPLDELFGLSEKNDR